jgi:hypothetical protein
MESQTLNVNVTYPAARKPYHQEGAPRSETLATLKTAVLNAFGLEETTAPDGTTTTYWFYKDKDRLENLAVTLGSLAGEAHALALKLAQQITQGARP